MAYYETVISSALAMEIPQSYIELLILFKSIIKEAVCIFKIYEYKYIFGVFSTCKYCQYKNSHWGYKVDGLVQDCSIASALALEILWSWTKPSRWFYDLMPPMKISTTTNYFHIESSPWSIPALLQNNVWNVLTMVSIFGMSYPHIIRAVLGMERAVLKNRMILQEF